MASPGVGSYLNANDEAIAYQTKSGENYAYLSGDGYFPGQNTNSDPLYRLQLTFDNGAVLRGTYAPGSANAFVAGTSVTVGNQTFTLTDFSFQRDRADTVSQYTAVRGGDSNDYFGNFVFNQSATAVPEPATWAMMMLGFGMVGFALRSRRNGKVTTRVAFA